MPPGQIHVLHVDDDPDFVDTSAALLEREDERLTVDTATSASDAHDRFATTDYDCLVADYDMPDQTGIALLEAVREEYPDVPFILFTGKGSEEVASTAFSAGATDYLQKSPGTDQYTLLANKITNYVDKYIAEQTMARRAQAMETATEGIALVNQDGHYTELNAAYADLYGADPDALLGKHWTVTVPDDEVNRLRDEAFPAARKQGSWSGQSRGQRADGRTYPKLLSIAPLDDGGHVCVVRDMTEYRAREQAIETLHATATDLMHADSAETVADMTVSAVRDVLDMPASGVHLYDDHDEGLVPVAWTERTEAIVGEPPTFEPGDSIAWTAFETGTPQIYDDIANVAARYNPETEVRSQIVLPLGDHGVLLIGSPTPDAFDDTDVDLGRTLATHATTALDRLDHAQQLERLRERMLFALETTNSLIWIVDHERETTDIYGSLDGVATDNLDTVDDVVATVVHPDDRDQVEQTMTAVHQGDTAEFTLAFRTHPDLGESRWLRTEGYRHSPDGAPVVVGLTTDITAQKQREQELERQNARLEKFASVVSHDLRNPLNVASGRLELAREECDSDFLDDVATAHSRIEALIDNLLTLAREGNPVETTDTVDLAHMVRQCWQTVSTADATLITDTEQTIQADPGRFKQLVENLIRNAVEHGGDDVTITVGDHDDGFYVADDGPGIPSAERAQVFETGYSTSDDGTGLGLTIVQEIVHAHGWEIAVRESETGGARFEVTGVSTAEK